jgi:PAS domain S-box-containing protein
MTKNSQSNSAVLKFIAVLLLPALGSLFRLLFLDGLGPANPYLCFYPAIMLAALWGGLPGGLASTAVSAFLASYYWIKPVGSFGIADPADKLGMIVFLAGSLLVSLLADLALRARARVSEAEAGIAETAERGRMALRQERDLLRQVVNAFPSSICVVDAGGTLLLANEAMASLNGKTARAMEGTPLQDCVVIPRELALRLSAQQREALTTGDRQWDVAEVPDGEGSWHSFEAVKTPLSDETGGGNKLLVVTKDTTERSRAEQALRENRELLHSIISGTPDPIYVKDTSGNYLLINGPAQAVMGRAAQEALGRCDGDIFGEQEVPAIFRGHTGTMDLFEDYLTDPEGRSRVFLTTKGPLYDSQGNLTGTFGIARDVSEQKMAQDEFYKLNEELDKRVAERTAQLEAANKEQEAFSYSVSHDLRSPLRHINSYAAILVEEHSARLTGEGRELLDRICRASSKMGKLIDDLLELARTSRIPLSEEPIDLSRLALISSLMLKQTNKDRRVDFTITPGLQVLGDKTLLRLVMENLLNNAWKYTVHEKVALIEVGMEIVEGQEVFYVSDNGTGFDMEYKDKLFGAFQRLHGSEYEGNGIGLATVKRAIERHGGAIWAEGEVGSGATFYFTLGKEGIHYPQQLRQSQG